MTRSISIRSPILVRRQTPEAAEGDAPCAETRRTLVDRHLRGDQGHDGRNRATIWKRGCSGSSV